MVSSIERALSRTALLAAALLLAGCAAQMAYREGTSLIAQDKLEEGLLRLQEATRQEPRNAEYRAAWLQARDRAAATLLQRGEQLTAAGKYADAEREFRRVQALDRDNERARAGLLSIEQAQRHARLMAEAAALEKKNPEGARAKLAAILAEQPQHESARQLLRALDAAPAAADPASVMKAAYRKPVTLEFRDAPLRQIFDVISRTAGLNFLFDKDVRTDTRASIFLRNSTVEAAIQYLLLTNQLDRQVLDGNTILIFPNNAAKQKDYQEMMIRTFFLANADAKAVAATLRGILKARDVVVDERLNVVVMRDNAESVALAEKLVALQDVPEPEVMLEVEILEIKRSRLTELGLRWPDRLEVTPLPLGSGLGGGLTLNDLRHQSSRTLNVEIGPAVLNARKADGDTNLLANPRIRTRNREKAKIFIGERVPNITTTATATGFVSESINYVDVGLTLNVEPTIHLDDDVAIKIGLEVNNIVQQLKTPSGSLAYQIGTRTASTVLRLKNGETQVLAGLISDEDRRTGNKVPALGDLPLVGYLFGSNLKDNQKTEIVLSITPRLIRNIERPDAAAVEFRSGTEGGLRSRSNEIVVRETPAPVPVAPSVQQPAVRPAQPLPSDLPTGQPLPPAGSLPR